MLTYEQFIDKFKIRLTDQQCSAVKSVNGPVLLLAVPGSGKTTVLVVRLGYMIHCGGISPESILTMTYTVAAANDMRTRFRSVFGDELCAALEFRTINGVCAKIIQIYERMTGGKAFDLLSDEKEISGLISAIYRDAAGTFPSEGDIKNVRTLITYAKNMMLAEKELSSLNRQCPRFSDIYKRYCEELRRRAVMDYDDQLVYAFNILKRYPSILAQIQERFQYICVDEAQDTSKIQHSIISLIASKSGNLFMVGDEDQSIYGFRAAYPEALTQFEQQHIGAKVLYMEKNFRSNALIVQAADKFISKNSIRHKKIMVPSRPEGEKICEVKLRFRSDQYEKIIELASAAPSEFVVLYRDNESALPLVDLLERRNIPYRIKAGDPSFFTHRIIQDIRSIITFSENPYDTEAFLQIYYKVSTYLNKSLAAEACAISRQENIPVWEAIFSLPELTAGAERGCCAIKAHTEKILLESGDQAIYRIYNQMGYREHLDRMGMKPHKIAILEAIGKGEKSVQGLMRRLDELESVIRNSKPSCNAGIILSTIHSSKGLEYDSVCIIDVCDGIFPETVIRNNQNTDRSLLLAYEEERRLFYVGMTRARNSLYLITYGDSPSYFCDDIFEKNIHKTRISARKSADVNINHTAMQNCGLNDREYTDFSEQCSAGSTIVHRFFGKGIVRSRDGDIINVEFNSGIKKLSVQSLFLQKLLR